jgi:spore coat protein SA
MQKIYHLLDEAEAFSESHGGAISRWMANVLRDGEEIIVCPSADNSWNFDNERLYVLPNWKDTHPIHPLLYRLPWSIQRRLYAYFFRKLLAKVKHGDLIYVHNRPECASALAALASKRGISVVLHMHNSHLIRANRGQLKALKTTPIVFCSEFLRKEADAALPGHFAQTFVVRNGADGVKFRMAERRDPIVPTIIFTGRLRPFKGVHILLKAMQLLHQRGVKARCFIVGRAYFANERTTRYVRSLLRQLPANTEMLGYKAGEELAALLRAADIFCCPSVWNDPFPLAPIEAMASGLPVVASRTGGIPEALAYGGGVMVPPNDPAALAAALEDLVGDSKRRKQLSQDGQRAFREHFGWDHVRAEYEDVIGKLASQAKLNAEPPRHLAANSIVQKSLPDNGLSVIS